jgi:hypothetical protein
MTAVGERNPKQAAREMLDQYEIEALHGAAVDAANVRIAPARGGIYLDLADPSGSAAWVTAHGWQVVTNPPVRFYRPPGLLPVPSPKPGGSLDGLRDILPPLTDEQWPLCAAWLVSVAHPIGPFPQLHVIGPEGSGKTTAAKLLRALIDPATPLLRAMCTTERDLVLAATHARIVAFDNLSGIS